MDLSRVSRTGWLTAGMALSLLCLNAQEEAFLPPAAPPAAPAEAAPAPDAEEAEDAEREEALRQFLAEIDKIPWQREGTGRLGSWAEIAIPTGYRFTDGDGARRLLELYGNLTGGMEQGLIGPEDLSWFITFDFFDIGYVQDDEKDELDADKLMEAMRKAQTHSNEERRRRQLPQLFNEGWVVKPHYDETTNNLEYGFKLRSDYGGSSINYIVKLLGRKGVMEAALVCDPADLDATLPKARELLAGYHFVAGETYAEYRSGDKVAQIGLTALVLGGGAALAAKSGLFAALAKFFGKFFKLILIGLVAIVAGFKKFLGGLFGSSRKSIEPPPPPPPAE